MAKIIVSNEKSFESAMRKFKQAGTENLLELRKREYYRSPSEKKREKHLQALRRTKLEEMKKVKSYGNNDK